MRFFKKKETPHPPVKSGFFSTEWNPAHTTASRRTQLQNQLDKTFKPDSTLKLVSGSAMDNNEQQAISMQMIKSYSSLGETIPEAQLNYFGGLGFIGYQTCAMLAQHWLINKACTMPAQDAVRNGYLITANGGDKVDPKILAEIKKYDKKCKIKYHAREFVRKGRIFGIRIAYYRVRSADPLYYEKPFNIDAVTPGSYQGLVQVDPQWTAPLLDQEAAANPASPDFYEPTWWLIQGRKYHRTHLEIFRDNEVTDVLKPAYLFGGISIPQFITERVYAAERTANEAPMLAMTKRLTTLSVDLTEAAANPDAFAQRMEIWTNYMNNFGVKVTGESEKVEQYDTSLADLDAVIMTQYQLVAAASGVPATKLLGTTPKGFNATGEYEESSYHEMLETTQECGMSPLIERHHELLMKSCIIPKFGEDFEIEVAWVPTDAETAVELADTNLKKAQTDAALSGLGAINGVDVRNRLILDRNSGYDGLEPIEEEFMNEPDSTDSSDSIEGGVTLSSHTSNTKIQSSKVSKQGASNEKIANE